MISAFSNEITLLILTIKPKENNFLIISLAATPIASASSAIVIFSLYKTTFSLRTGALLCNFSLLLYIAFFF